ncbi:gastrin-releasing peptide receptor-like isoform X2 [Periplaneta americana]
MYDITVQPTLQCFRPRNESSGMSANTNETSYKNFVPSESCVKQEIADIKQKAEQCKLSKDFTNVAKDFVNSHNKTVGLIFIKSMTSYLQDVDLLVRRFKSFNTFVIANNVTTENITYNIRRCEKYSNMYKNVLIMFGQLYNVTNQYYVIIHYSRRARQLMGEYKVSYDVATLEEAYEQMVINEKNTEEFVQRVRNLVEFRKKTQLDNTFLNNVTRKLLNVEYWKNISEQQKNETLKYQEYLVEEKFRIPLQHYIQPAVNAIIFIVGFVGNVVLAVIIIRHRQMRTTANMLLLNLAVGDMLNLLVNIPAFYTYFTSNSWELGEAMCKIYRFLRQLGIGVSVYSVVVLSVQKYVILTRFTVIQNNSALGQQMKRNLKIFLTASTAWLIGLIVAIPHTIYSGIYQGNCFGFSKELHVHYSKGITVFDLLIFCIIPLSIIGIFSILSSKILQYSVKTMPGESMGTEKCVKARIVSSRVLIAITAVSAVSYVPLYLYLFFDAWVGGEADARISYFVFFLTYALLFGNSCFNPIALCVASKKFRRGFKRYLLCRKDEIVDENQTQQAFSSTCSTSLETKV